MCLHFRFIHCKRNKKKFSVTTKRLQNKIAESKFALPVTAIYALAACTAYGLFSQQLWIQFMLLALSTLMMVVLNNDNALIRIYSRMVSCSFLVLALMGRDIITDARTGLVQFLYILFYFFLFRAYQNKRAVGSVFYAFMALGTAGVFFPKILFLVPVMWIVMFTNIMAGSTRTLAASVLGMLLPYWFLGAYCTYTGDFTLLTGFADSIATFGNVLDIADMPQHTLLQSGATALLAFVGMIHFRRNNYKDRIRTRMLFEIFSISAILTIAFIMLQPCDVKYLMPLLAVNTAPLIGHYIALTKTMLTNISFFIILGATLLITIYGICQPF